MESATRAPSRRSGLAHKSSGASPGGRPGPAHCSVEARGRDALPASCGMMRVRLCIIFSNGDTAGRCTDASPVQRVVARRGRSWVYISRTGRPWLSRRRRGAGSCALLCSTELLRWWFPLLVRAALWRGGGWRAVRRKTITKREMKKHAKEAGKRGETGGVEEKKGLSARSPRVASYGGLCVVPGNKCSRPAAKSNDNCRTRTCAGKAQKISNLSP